MATFKFQLVTPERTLIDAEVESVTCPTTTGQITILPQHAPLLTELSVGELIAHTTGGQQVVSVVGGFLQIQANNSVVVLADTAEHIDEIDEQAVVHAVTRAQERLAQQTLSAEEYAVVSASLERNLSHLQVVRKHAHRRRVPITGEGVRED